MRLFTPRLLKSLIRHFCGVAGLLILAPPALAQSIEVDLTTQASFAADQYHVIPFLQTSPEELVLPDLEGVPFVYVAFHHPGLGSEDTIISGVLIDEEEAETLFIDKNNDEDLTNDGLPDFFPSMETSLRFMISWDGKDVEVILSRELEGDDAAFVSGKGHLKKEIVAPIQGSDPNYLGTAGSFLFASYPNLRRGRWQTEQEEFTIALYDANTNGAFNDESDVFLIDLNADGRFGSDTQSEFYRLEEPFVVQGQSFRLEQVYPNGTRFVLRPIPAESSY